MSHANPLTSHLQQGQLLLSRFNFDPLNRINKIRYLQKYKKDQCELFDAFLNLPSWTNINYSFTSDYAACEGIGL